MMLPSADSIGKENHHRKPNGIPLDSVRPENALGGDVAMPRGGKRSTSFKPGQSGNPAGWPRKYRALLLQRIREEGFVGAIKIQLEITTAGVAALCRCGLVTPGYEKRPQAIAHGLLEAAARYLGLKGAPDPGISIVPGG
jgi:hypothetical protein